MVSSDINMIVISGKSLIEPKDLYMCPAKLQKKQIKTY